MGRKIVFMAVFCLLWVCGCEGLRFAANESQKANAWLHGRTAELTADVAVRQGGSDQLCELARLSAMQGRAFVADYGMPEVLPMAGNVEQVLSSGSYSLAEAATVSSQARPDVWDVADGAIELGIGLAGLLGGVYGVRVAGALKQARQKSEALKDIVNGNELFKRQNAESAVAFNAAQGGQSVQTKQIVTEIKRN